MGGSLGQLRWGREMDLSTGPRLGLQDNPHPCSRGAFWHFTFTVFDFLLPPLNLKRHGGGSREGTAAAKGISLSSTLPASPPRGSAPHPLAGVSGTCQTHPRSFTKMQRTISFFFLFFVPGSLKKKKKKRKTPPPSPKANKQKKNQPNPPKAFFCLL